MPFKVGLKRRHVPLFVGQLLEITRASGQREADDGIAAIEPAGKNCDSARAFRGVEAEGKAEEHSCVAGEIFRTGLFAP